MNYIKFSTRIDYDGAVSPHVFSDNSHNSFALVSSMDSLLVVVAAMDVSPLGRVKHCPPLDVTVRSVPTLTMQVAPSSGDRVNPIPK